MAHFNIGDFVEIVSGVYVGRFGYVINFKTHKYMSIRLTNGQEVDILYSYVVKVKE